MRLCVNIGMTRISHKYHILGAFELNSSTMFFNHFQLKELFLFIEKFFEVVMQHRHNHTYTSLLTEHQTNAHTNTHIRTNCNLLKQRICSIFSIVNCNISFIFSIQVVRWWNNSDAYGAEMGYGKTQMVKSAHSSPYPYPYPHPRPHPFVFQFELKLKLKLKLILEFFHLLTYRIVHADYKQSHRL